MNSIAIQGTKRGELGKKDAKKCRREGKIPCVIYGGKENIHFSAPKLAVRDLVYTSQFAYASVDLDGSKIKCILKDVVFHPVTDEIVHMDFLELVDGKIAIVDIPVGYKGTAPGVKLGGTLIPKLRKAKIKTAPENIVEKLYVDVSKLQLGFSVRVKDIELKEGMQIMNSLDIPVFSVETPRALRAAGAAAEAIAGAAEEAGAEAAAE